MRIGPLKISGKMPHKYDIFIHVAMLVLIAFGTLMIISTNVGNTYEDQLVLVKIFVKQVVFIVVGYFGCVFFANNFTMKRAQKLLFVAYVVIVALLVLTLKEEAFNGSRAWIRINLAGTQVTIQPAEFVKVFMPVAMAVFIEIAGRRNFPFWTIVKAPLVYLVTFAGLIMLQRDFGTLLIILAISGICFLIPSHKNFRHYQKIAKAVLVAVVCGSLLLISDKGIEMMQGSHIATRIENTLNPYEDPFGKGAQPINGLYAIAHSGIIGQGFGSSTVKYGFLSEMDTDYILAVIIEETGIFGLSLIVLCYFVILYRLFYYAFRTKSEGYKIILIGVGMYIILHFVWNVGGVGGLIPLSGVPLLFISSGGSSLLSIMLGIGIAQAVIAKIKIQGE